MQLRDRINLAFTGYGLVFGILLGATVGIAFFVVEDALLDHFLNDTARQVQEAGTGQDNLLLPPGFSLYGDDAPADIGQLAPGRYEVAQFRHVAVFDDPGSGTRRFLVLDESAAGYDILLSRILFGTLLVIVLAILIGTLFARRMTRELIKPLDTLVARVDAVGAEQPVLEPLQRDDEIGFLSNRFARALKAREEHVRRERDFSRFASHELRSPITVLRGTFSILRGASKLSGPSRRALQRAERATDKMARLVETFLSLARGDEPVATTDISSAALSDMIEELEASQDESRPQTDIQVLPGSFRANRMLLAVLLENLLTNARQHGVGTVSVKIAPPAIRISNDVAAEDDRGHGFGLEICARVCERLGFGMAVSRAGQRFTVTLTDNNRSADDE